MRKRSSGWCVRCSPHGCPSVVRGPSHWRRESAGPPFSRLSRPGEHLTHQPLLGPLRRPKPRPTTHSPLTKFFLGASPRPGGANSATRGGAPTQSKIRSTARSNGGNLARPRERRRGGRPLRAAPASLLRQEAGAGSLSLSPRVPHRTGRRRKRMVLVRIIY